MPPAIVVLLILVVIGALVLTNAYSESQRIRRALKSMAPTAIGSLPEGQQGRIIGTVQALEPLVAPLTGRRCVYYDATIEERHTHNNRSHWRMLVREVRGVPFAIEDGTGRAIVNPGQARVALVVDHSTSSGSFDDATRVEEGFLARHGMKSTGWFFNRTLRYREGAIEVGERVSVLGRGVREPDPDAIARVSGYRDLPPTRLRIEGASGIPLYVSDHLDTTT